MRTKSVETNQAGARTQETEFPIRMSINLANYYKRCEEQRDELVKACQRAVGALKHIDEEDMSMAEKQMLIIIRAAIAKAEGSAQS